MIHVATATTCYPNVSGVIGKPSEQPCIGLGMPRSQLGYPPELWRGSPKTNPAPVNYTYL